MNGLARNADATILAVLRKYVIEKTSSDRAFESVVLSLLSANGSLFKELDEVTYERISVLVTDRIGQVDISLEHTKFSHPASLFVSLLKNNEEQFVIEKLGDQMDAFIERFPYSAYFTSNVTTFASSRERLLLRLTQNARSSDFGTANAFARHIDDVEKLLGDSLSPDEAFSLLVGVIRAADIGAYGSIDLRNSHFGSLPKLRSLALERVTADSASAKTLAAEILGVPESNVDNELLYLQPLAPGEEQI